MFFGCGILYDAAPLCAGKDERIASDKDPRRFDEKLPVRSRQLQLLFLKKFGMRAYTGKIDSIIALPVD